MAVPKSGEYIDINSGEHSVDRTGNKSNYGGSSNLKVRRYSGSVSDYAEIRPTGRGDGIYITPTAAFKLAMALFAIAEEAGVVPKED